MIAAPRHGVGKIDPPFRFRHPKVQGAARPPVRRKFEMRPVARRPLRGFAVSGVVARRDRSVHPMEWAKDFSRSLTARIFGRRIHSEHRISFLNAARETDGGNGCSQQAPVENMCGRFRTLACDSMASVACPV